MNKKVLKSLFPRKILNELIIRRSSFPCNQPLQERVDTLVSMFKRHTGGDLDLSNPVSFNEKIQWLKLYYKHPDMHKIVCKYNFKKYIEKKAGKGYTVPLYGAWTDERNIDFDKLPRSFVLKSNCSSGGNFIKIIKDKSKINIAELRKELRSWLEPSKLMINSYCSAYWKVRPMILAEEYIEQLDGQVYDYKFFCFGGEPKFAYVATDHFEGQISKISVYDLD